MVSSRPGGAFDFGNLGNHALEAVEGFFPAVFGTHPVETGHGDLGFVGRFGAVFFPELVIKRDAVGNVRVRFVVDFFRTVQGDEVEESFPGDVVVAFRFGELEGFAVVFVGLVADVFGEEDVALEVVNHLHDLDTDEFFFHAVELLESGIELVLGVVAFRAVVEGEGQVDVAAGLGVFGEEGVEQAGGFIPLLEARVVRPLEVEDGLAAVLFRLVIWVGLDVVLDERVGFVILAGVVVAAGEDEEADVVRLGGSGELGKHDRGDLDAFFVFAFPEEAGEHHAADFLLVVAVRVVLEENGAVFLGGENLSDERGGADEVVEVLFAGGHLLFLTGDLGLGVVELELLVAGKGTTDVSGLLVHEGGVEEGVDLVYGAFAVFLFQVIKLGLEGVGVDDL